MKQLLLLILLGLAAPAWATTYYVSTGGTGTNCTQAQNPSTRHNTIAEGIACMSTGDTLIIGNGVYVTGEISPPSGSAGAHTIIVAENRNQAILRPSSGNAVFWFRGSSYVTIDGIDADCANVSGVCSPYLYNNSFAYPHHITLQHGTARNAKGTFGSGIELGAGGNHLIWDMDVIDNGTDPQFDHGIYVYGSNVTIDGNRIRGSAGWGVHIYHGCDGADGCNSTGLVVRNNTIYSNRNRSGILVVQASGTRIFNNVLYDNGGSGVEFFGGSSGTLVDFNTITANGQYCVSIVPGASGTQVRNNICWANAANSIANSGTSTTLANNLMTDPRFVSEGGANFHLRDGSQAIGTGTFNALVTTDADGNARPNPPSRGAYEAAATTLIVISPSSGNQGATLPINVTGINTNFVNMTSAMTISGTGVTVNSTTVSSPTAAVVNVTIAGGATLAFRNVTMTTGAEVVTLANGFLVTGAPTAPTNLRTVFDPLIAVPRLAFASEGR